MSTLHISCWNIQGLYSSTFGIKSIQPEFLENIENVDILILTETWCRTDMQTHCPKGYHEIVIPSLKNKNVNHGRDSGGILVWYREKLANHISITQTGKSHCWVELKSNSGMLTNNLYLCAIYIPPIDSPYYEEEYMNNQTSAISRPREMCCCVGTLTPELAATPTSLTHKVISMCLVKTTCTSHQTFSRETVLTMSSTKMERN